MSFYTEHIAKSAKFNTTEVVKDISFLEPGTRAAVQKLSILAKELGKDLRIAETYRSQSRQLQVYNAGNSKLKKVGCHGYGLACDFVLFTNGKYDTKAEHYNFLVDLCKKVGLISGIDWGYPNQKHTFIDSGHVQRIPVFRQKEVFACSWYPPENYDPYKDIENNDK
jgi:hypothetical protein